MPDTSVDIRDLVKHHGSTRAVDHLSLSVVRGEFFSILGPSGSGKTTLLRLLAGFERPDQGEILIEGRAVARPDHVVPANQRSVNLVFQTYALFPHLNVFENIAFGLRMRGTPVEELSRAVSGITEMVKLQGKERRYPAQLSGGEQQRVALARALVNRPAVLLLDEPLSALDQQLRQDMQMELKTIQERTGITFLYVTHHQEEALTMSDRLAVMHHGRVLQVGSPRDLYETPACGFVAEFIGKSNQVTGRILELDGPHCVVDVPDFPRLVARRPARPIIGGEVTISVRPERLRMTAVLPGDRSPDRLGNSVPARVEKVVYGGSDILYVLRLPAGHLWKSRVVNTNGEQKRFSPGEQVYLKWHADEGVTLTE